MFTIPTLATVLAIVPQPPTAKAPPEFTAELHRAEFVIGDDDVVLHAYDVDAQVIGSIALWAERDGTIVVVSDYGDGFAQTTILPSGQVVTEATLSAEAIAERAVAMANQLNREYAPQAQAAGWLSCSLSVVGTAISCAGAQPWCPIAASVAACNCVPLMSEEFEEMKCPGFQSH
jgi:hypothetical protein